jgi:benzodiazapine receptor
LVNGFGNSQVKQALMLKWIIFFVLNFGALGLGGFFTGDGVISAWYTNLNQAPWTPPGWVFGAAWTIIMLCFTAYMAFLWPAVKDKKTLIGIFAIQWILNVVWNPLFFYFQNIWLGLIVIVSLTLLVGYFLFKFKSQLKLKTLLIFPYFLWLIIATSLNLYIFAMN